MKRETPGSVTTIGTMNIILGSLFSFCCLSFLTIQLASLQGFGNAQEIEPLLERELPGHKVINWTSQGLGLICFLLMTISGIGLVSRANWARVLAITNGWILMPFLIGMGVYHLAWEMPVTARILRQVQGPLAREGLTFLWFICIIRIALYLLIFTYALIMVILLMGGRVRDFFTQTGFEDGFYEEEGWGPRDRRDDRDYPRRDRPGWRDWD